MKVKCISGNNLLTKLGENPTYQPHSKDTVY